MFDVLGMVYPSDMSRSRAHRVLEGAVGGTIATVPKFLIMLRGPRRSIAPATTDYR